MLQPPSERTRERLLLYGPSGVGKSRAALSIATRAAASGSDARFYVIDSDFAWERMLDGADPGNVEVFETYDWPDYRAALAKIEGSVKKGDWVVVDMIGPAWDAVQNYFVQEVHGQGEDEYFLAVRKELSEKAKSLGALSGWLDWPVVKKMYFNWANRLLLRMPCHVLAITPAERISQETDEKPIRDVFGPLGSKPGGQKHLPHSFHSVIQMGKSQGMWVMTSAKERGERRGFTSVQVSEFWMSYLVRVAGWKP